MRGCTINLKSLQSDASGRIFTAVKTTMDKTGRPDSPQIFLMVRGLNGEWINHVFGRVRDAHTRPVVLIDEENNDLYLLATAPTGGGAIYYKKTPLSNISFEAGRGRLFIQSSSDPKVNDVTSTKQTLNSETGLLGLAADDTTGHCLHNYIELDESADTTPPETTIDSGSGPSGTVDTGSATFEFTSSEAGSTFEYSLDGADFEDCASPKEYENLDDGEHNFQVRAIDVSGTDPTPDSRAWTVDTGGAGEDPDDTTSPTIEPISPKPGAKIKNRRPAIKAVVEDNLTNLSKEDIRLFVANKEVPQGKFGYNQGNDRLEYRSPKLSFGNTEIRIVARDEAGNSTSKAWRFKVIR